MFRQKAEIFNYILRTHDIGIIVFSFLLTYLFRRRMPEFSPLLGPLYPLNEYVWVLILAIPILIIMLKYYGAYEPFQKKNYTETIWIITRAVLIGMITLFAILYITKSAYISRSFILAFSLTTYVLLVIGRLMVRVIMRELYRQGFHLRNILIVGTGRRARMYVERIAAHQEWGVKIVGYVDDQPAISDQALLGAKIIGKLEDIPTLIEKNVIDEVVVILPRRWLSQLENIVRACEEMGIEITIAADFFDTTISKTCFTIFYDLPLLTLSTSSPPKLQIMIKNIFDTISAIILLILSFPLFIITAIVIKLTSCGPVFYKQTRCCLNGRKFTMYKFRTMYIDAEEHLALLREYNEMDGPVFKMQNDPRVTPIGSFLRKTSTDEWPQLINVLKGEMSLVGPRPPLPEETWRYDRWQRRRLSVKPGITGLWQVSGRNTIDFQEWMKLDLYYIDHWSLWLDVQILLKTLPAVIKGTGAW